MDWVKKGAGKIIAAKIDDLFSENIKFDFIKLDIEGAEYNALLGMQETIKRSKIRGMIVEIADHHLRKFGHSNGDIVNLLSAFGFKCISHKIENILSPAAETIFKTHWVPK